jgi:adenylate cyclase
LKRSSAYTQLDDLVKEVTGMVDAIQAILVQKRPAVLPVHVYEDMAQVKEALPKIGKAVYALERERQILDSYTQIGQTLNTSLEIEVVLKAVLDEVIRLSGAERCSLFLKGTAGNLELQVARNWEQDSIDPNELTISKTVIQRVADTGIPVLTSDAQEDKRFATQASVVFHNLRSILCVPLQSHDTIIGVIYLDSRVRTGAFTQKELEMINIAANQAAIAIENARLFDSVKQALGEVTALKNLLDQIFRSIPSGVITTNFQNQIVLSNRMAQQLLGMEADQIQNKTLDEVLFPFIPILKKYVEIVLQENVSLVGLETTVTFKNRSPIDLRFSLAPLRDIHEKNHGVAIVLDDLTEKRRLEAHYRLFEKMVSPAVIQNLDPKSIQPGGKRAEVTVLFADLRGFTALSEVNQPETLVTILNRYLSTAADCVLKEGGTIDKFMGDAIMAWFNAPVAQADHTFHALRAALQIRSAMEELHKDLPEEFRLYFSFGIHVGDAILGLIGTEKRLDYTAIGDCVNIAKRLQENSGPGQIYISQTAYLRVKERVVVSKLGPIIARGKKNRITAYQVIQTI